MLTNTMHFRPVKTALARRMKDRTTDCLKLRISDYLAETAHLCAIEHGAYLLLMMCEWRNGPLPDDDRKLAAIARVDAAEWRRIGPTVMALFTATPDGFMQPRLERERSEAFAMARGRSGAASVAAAKRWATAGSAR